MLGRFLLAQYFLLCISYRIYKGFAGKTKICCWRSKKRGGSASILLAGLKKMSDKKYFAEYNYVFEDDGVFPNSPLPVLLYKGVLDLPSIFPAAHIEQLFSANGWSKSWKAGIYTFPHYHSNTHEVLGVYNGETNLQLGGDKGSIIKLEKGDVLIIPAGVCHRNMGPEYAVSCVGAYPEGVKYNMNYGKPGERPVADETILAVPAPERDPVLGLKGGTSRYWKRALSGR